MITVSTMFTIISIKPNNWHASPHHHQSEWTSSCVAKSKAFPHQPQHTDCWLWTYSRLIWSGYNWLKAIRIHLNFPKYKISSAEPIAFEYWHGARRRNLQSVQFYVWISSLSANSQIIILIRSRCTTCVSIPQTTFNYEATHPHRSISRLHI